jgi:hypothetical protein
LSGSTLGGVVGGAIGFFVGGPAGAQWGFMIGSAIGGYVDPMKIEGPRLTDAMQQTSQDGVPIPFGYGTFPTAGNIIWTDELKEHKKEERQGKGGPEVTSYTYTRSCAVGICAGPITGLLMIKRNGKVVWDVRDQATLSDYLFGEPFEGSASFGGYALQVSRRIHAYNARFENRATFYLGDEEQLPDPTMEAVVGIGKTPAHRGLAYMVVKDDDLTDMQGAIPQYEFVVSGAGTLSEALAPGVYWNILDTDTEEGSDLALTQSSRDITASGTGIAASRGTIGASSGRRYFEVEVLTDVGQSGQPEFWTGLIREESPLDADFYQSNATALWLAPAPTLSTDTTTGTAPAPPYPAGTVLGWAVDFDTRKVWLSINGAWYEAAPETHPGGLRGDTFTAGHTWMPYFGREGDGSTDIPPLARLRIFPGELQHKPSDFAAWSAALDGANLPDADGWFVLPDGSLATSSAGEVLTTQPVQLGSIVADLLGRVGITSDSYDVSQLTAPVVGYKVATQSGVDAMIGALMPAFFFDAVEYDGKLRFVERGGDAVVSIGADDLAERDSEAVTLERVQEAELLRKVTVGYIDPMTAYTSNTQAWERRSGTIEAKGESASELPIVCTSRFAAQVAEKRGKVAWAEPEKLLFSLPALRWARLVPTTVLHVPVGGQMLRARIASIEEDSGVLLVEASRDRQAAYVGTASGVLPPPPLVVDPPLIGPTKLAVMDLPVWRESDDALGVYVAASGYLAGWRGCEVQVSTDAGASYTAAALISEAATLGVTTSALSAWPSAEAPSSQSLRVSLPGAPASVSYEKLLQLANRAALRLDDGAWEILQFQTVETNADGTYTLSGLVRGRYATTPGAAASGAAFVLLNDAVQFVPMQRHLINAALQVRAVGYGTDPDAALGSPLTVAGRSQIEWPVHSVSAVRDASDTVTVAWVGRGRIGAETVAYHSQHFVGYRVTFSDGHSADVTTSNYVRTATPAGVTVTIAALNSITGAGPSSEAISA